MRVISFLTQALCLLVLISSVGCDDTVRQSFPELEVDPNPVVMPAVRVGEQTTKRLLVRNAGGSELIITEIEFSNTLDEREFTVETPALPIRLQAEEELTISLSYGPQDVGIDEGDMIFTSNSRSGLEYRVPIRTTVSNTDLIADPNPLGLFSPEGEAVTESVRLYNIGSVPILIEGFEFSADTDEEFRLVTPSMAVELGQDEEMMVEVEYTPGDRQDDYGELIFSTNSEGQPRVVVQLQGATPSPEIVVTPESVNFGAIDLNDTSEQVEVFIENRGTQPLVISSIGLALATPPPNNEQFTLHDLPDLAEGPVTVNPMNIISFSVSYAPTVEGRHETAVVIENNDVDESIKTVPLTGRVRQPCIEVIPEEVDFGAVALNIESARSMLNIINCGDLPLTVQNLALDNPSFSWAPLDGFPRADVMLAPLQGMPIEVWFTNTNTPQGQDVQGTLTVNNDSPDNPALEVPLTATGGGAPSCSLLIRPRRVDFGLVARGRSVSRSLEIVNRGTGHCDITGQEVAPLIDIPIPGFNAVRFVITGQAPLGRIGPGATVPIEVTYRPQIFAADAAKLRINYDDPFAQEAKTAEADLSGVGGDSNISVIPSRVDFGAVTAGDCASREERVTVYNTGVVNLCITDIRFSAGCPEFLVTDRPLANEDGCILVTRNQPAEVRLQYEPTNLGPDECALIFESDANNAPELRVPLSGEGVADSRTVDEFVQTSGRTVDVLFVIDNSGSMGEEQENLQDNFASFINGAQQFSNDYQLGVVTTDMVDDEESGRLQGNPRIMRRGANISAQFENASDVGTRGAGTEQGLEAAEKALKDPLSFDTGVACQADGDCVEPDRCVEGTCGGFNRGFLREDAALEIVFVSDEDDSSTATLNYYIDFFKNIKGFRNESRFHAHAIVGAVNGRAANCDSGLGSAAPGRAYVDVANRTNGSVYSICDGDFGRALQDIGNQAFGLPVQFFLSRPAQRNSIRVSVNGQARNAGWQYDEESNSVIFDEAQVPQPRQTVRVEYDAQCFPRRN